VSFFTGRVSAYEGRGSLYTGPAPWKITLTQTHTHTQTHICTPSPSNLQSSCNNLPFSFAVNTQCQCTLIVNAPSSSPLQSSRKGEGNHPPLRNATLCNTLQHSATHYNTFERSGQSHQKTRMGDSKIIIEYTATHTHTHSRAPTLQYSATHISVHIYPYM